MMKKLTHYLKVIILSFSIFFLGYYIFSISIMLFPIWVLLSILGFVVVVIAEWLKKFQKLSWVLYLSFAWLIIIVPTFGIMPILFATRLHFELPNGNQLGIFAGFTYTAIYDFFVPSPELYEWDHPFPPVTNAQLYILGSSILAISSLPFYFCSGGGKPGKPDNTLEYRRLSAR